MVLRSLFGVLILLLITAPLSALVCGSCAPDHCLMASTAETVVEGHCAGVEEASGEESAPAAHCGDMALVMVAADCCLLGVAPEPETAATPTVIASSDFVLELAIAVGAEALGVGQADNRRQTLLRLAPQPLYTLHSTLLI